MRDAQTSQSCRKFSNTFKYFNTFHRKPTSIHKTLDFGFTMKARKNNKIQQTASIIQNAGIKSIHVFFLDLK